MYKNLANIGLVATEKRNIRPGNEFNDLFPDPAYTDPVLHPTMDVEKTIELMAKIVKEHKHETKKITELLYVPDVYSFAQNIWNFVYEHIQYALDKNGVEELRTPARTWADRQSGVDCDCMSIFISSILRNSPSQIPHHFRVTKYGHNAWQHVYVVIPTENSEIIIDTVMDKFNKEKPPTAKWDFNAYTGKPLKNTPVNGLGNFQVATPTNPIVKPPKDKKTMFTWMKSNPVTSAAIGILAVSAGYVAYDTVKKKSKPKAVSGTTTQKKSSSAKPKLK